MDTQKKANAEHPSYSAQQEKRNVYRSVYGGTDAMRKDAAKHLPKYPAESDAEYKVRLASATIDGIVLGGVDTLCGSVFEGEIDVTKVAPQIVSLKLLENIDNQGNHFNIFARDAFRESFDGFSAILVDMPNAKAADAEQERALGLRPYWTLYKACDVINWRYRVNPVSKQKELTLVVFREITSEPDGMFGSKDIERYRVLHLDNGVVRWEVWIKSKDGDGKDTYVIDVDDKGNPKQGTIEKVKAIPVAFIGDVMNDPKLLVESRLEIKAYQKESSFDTIEYLSVPTFYTVGYDGEEQLKLGASGHLKLPASGQGQQPSEAGFVQIDAKGHESLKGTIEQIKNFIRARVNYLVQSAMPKAQDKTATQVVTEDKDKQARLVVWADELKDALETALQYTGQFLGLGDDAGGEIVLKTKWMVAEEKAVEQQARDAESHKANIAATMAKAVPAK